MENPFKHETTMKSFLSQDVSAPAHDAAQRLLSDPQTISIEIDAANSKFTVSKRPLAVTMWQFEFQGVTFYLGPTETE